MNSRRQTFSKAERLCSIKIISGLFDDGNFIHTSLLTAVWKISPAVLPFPAQVAFSVSKKNFRLAVTRNLIKRRIKEAYRKHKADLYITLEEIDCQIVFMIIFKGNRIPVYTTVESSVKEILGKLEDAVKTRERIC